MIPKAWCLYTRLSYAPDGSVEKVERQEADGRARGRALSWPEPCCVYRDNSRSAWQRNRKRPDWDKMLRTVDASGALLVPGTAKADHVHDGIMTYHGDRLIRQPYDLEVLLNLAWGRDFPLASVTGVRDLANPDDRFILRIEAAQACRASDDTSRRVKRGRLATATKGGMRPGGRRTFGWGLATGETRKVIDPVTDEVRVVEVRDSDALVPSEIRLARECAEIVLAGLSLRAALSWMNKRSLTTGGRPWTGRGLKQMLGAYRMAGYVEYKGDLYEARWPPVYADTRDEALEMVEAIRAIFATNLNTYGYYGRERKYLLTGIGECGGCHAPSAEEPEGGTCRTSALRCGRPHRRIGRKPVNGTDYYYCPQCHRGRTMANLDGFIDGRTLRFLNSPELIAELNAQHVEVEERRPSYAAQIAALKARKKEKEGQLKRLADHPNLDPALLLQALASFDERIVELEAKAGSAQRSGVLGRLIGITPEAWKDEDMDVRSEAVGSLFRIIVHRTTQRGPGFDPATIEVVRRKLGPPDDVRLRVANGH
jgi:DNA invertase Pin-like site-specific DNA recombinase